jgi:hypothetical protein
LAISWQNGKFDNQFALNWYLLHRGEITSGIASMKQIASVDTKAAIARERLRRRYLPAHVNVLFVGEAPPASGRFFYQADSGLYRAIRDAFLGALPALRDGDFLEAFRARHCYLIDLCGKPVDRLNPKERRKACRDGEIRLSKILKKLLPKIVITVVRSIAPNVRRARDFANWRGRHLDLPYPGRWKRHRLAFLKALTPVIRGELTRGTDLPRKRVFAQKPMTDTNVVVGKRRVVPRK